MSQKQGQKLKSKAAYSQYTDLTNKPKKTLNKKTSVENIVNSHNQRLYQPASELITSHIHCKSLQNMDKIYQNKQMEQKE